MTEETTYEPCPLQHGDRVSHSTFGFGTVVGDPQAYVGPLMEPPWMQHQGWRLSIELDNTGEVAEVTHPVNPEHRRHIEKVADGAARGLHFWKHEWQKLFDRVEAQRTQTAYLMASSFRSSPGTADKLDQQLAELRSTEDELVSFLNDQESRAHI